MKRRLRQEAKKCCKIEKPDSSLTCLKSDIDGVLLYFSILWHFFPDGAAPWKPPWDVPFLPEAMLLMNTNEGNTN